MAEHSPRILIHAGFHKTGTTSVQRTLRSNRDKLKSRFVLALPWKLHREMTLNLQVVMGTMRFVLYDERPDSATRGRLEEITLSAGTGGLLVVPPNVWSGFQGLESPVSIVANCATRLHDPHEVIRREPYDSYFPYEWPSLDGAGRS